LTISGTNLTTSPDTTPVTFAAGDTGSWQMVPSSGPTPGVATGFFATYTSTGSNSGEGFMAGTSVSSSANVYFSPTGGASSATESAVSMEMPTAGTLDLLNLEVSGAVGSGATGTITLWKNGSATTLTTNVSGTSQTVATPDTTHSVSWVAGDLISIALTVSGTVTARQYKWSMRWTPTVDGETPVMARTVTLTVTAARYILPLGIAANATSEAATQAIVPYPFVFKNMSATIDALSGAGKQWNFQDRNTGVTGNLSVVLANVLTNNDTTHTDSYAAGDSFNYISTPTGTPTAFTKGMFGGVLYVAPTPSGYTPVPDLRVYYM
jgi:hypothetical protein